MAAGIGSRPKSEICFLLEIGILHKESYRDSLVNQSPNLLLCALVRAVIFFCLFPNTLGEFGRLSK